MKIKKVLILAVISASCSVSWPTIVLGQQEKEQSQSVEQLQEKIEELEKILESQKNTIRRHEKTLNQLNGKLDEQIKENKRLLALCRKAGINTNEPAKTNLAEGDIVYRGKKRSQKWFDEMYEKFNDKIACFDGKYFDIVPSLRASGDGKMRPVNRIDSDSMTWPVGTLVGYYFDAKVISVLGKGEVLISNGLKYGRIVVCHLQGLEGSFADGQEITKINDRRFVYAGIFKYTAASGEHKTVPSLVVYKPLTREQFTEALASGFKLVDYQRIGKRVIEKPIR